MQKTAGSFAFSYHGQMVQVQPRRIGRDTVYTLYFEDGTLPLVITLAKADNGAKFWTSLPEGRQAEADLFGPYLSSYLADHPTIHQRSVEPLRLFE